MLDSDLGYDYDDSYFDVDAIERQLEISQRKARKQNKGDAKTAYTVAKVSPLGSSVECAGCGKTFVKKRRPQAFCRSQCRHLYHNCKEA